MATTYTTQLQLALPTAGELDGTWGSVVNDNITKMVEEAIAGIATVSTWAGASHTLTTANGTTAEARCMILLLSGAPGAAGTVLTPAVGKVYMVTNSVTGGYAVTVKVSGQTGVSVPNGSTMWLYCNGTDIVTGGNYASSLTLGAALPVLSGGTGVTTSTGSGANVLATSPTLVTPLLGTPTSGVMTNVTGLPLTTGVTGTLPVANGGTGVTTSTGSGANALATSPTLVTPILGTPTSGTMTNVTGLPLTTGVTGTLPVANGGTGVTTSTGSGANALATSPTLVTPALGTPSSGVLTNCTGGPTLTGATLNTSTLVSPTITGYTETPYTANTGASITLDLTNGTLQILTLTANATITMPTAVSGKSFMILLKQDGTGSRTVTWTTVAWPSAAVPTLTTTASKLDIVSFVSDGTKWYGAMGGQNYTP